MSLDHLPALNPASPLASLRGHHVAVRVPDFEVAKRWYIEKLDFRLIETRLELFEAGAADRMVRARLDSRPDAEPSGRQRLRLAPVALFHATHRHHSCDGASYAFPRASYCTETTKVGTGSTNVRRRWQERNAAPCV